MDGGLKKCTVCQASASFKAPFKRLNENRWFWFCEKEACFKTHTNTDWNVLLPKHMAEEVWKNYTKIK